MRRRDFTRTVANLAMGPTIVTFLGMVPEYRDVPGLQKFDLPVMVHVSVSDDGQIATAVGYGNGVELCRMHFARLGTKIVPVQSE